MGDVFMNNEFKIGCNYQIITPPLGTLLYGYVAKRPASSVHDDEGVKKAEHYLNEIKKEMIEEMNKTRKRA